VPVSPSRESHSIANLPAKFILLGEDDIDDEDLLREIIGNIDESFYLLFMDNGRKLLERLNELPDNHLPCLIVLDYNMPELNGAEILTEIRKNSRYTSIPKVIWSTSNSEMFRRTCIEAGANEYLIKPSNVNDLVDVARHMLSLC
jgi:CheY-like chemotaxis protein